MIDWSGVVTNAVWAGIGATGVYLWRRFSKWHKNLGHGALLSGLEEPTLFVFPSRKGGPERLLPQMAIEDFLAINNLISAFLRVDKRPPDKIRDHSKLTVADRKNNNLILICSSKSNKITKEAIDLLRVKNGRLADLIPFFEDIPGKLGEIQIKWNKGTFPSESYDQGRSPTSEGQDQTGPLDDMAVIVKARNPWAEQHTLLIVAGIRGIGTWGAAELLKKWWKELYDRKDSSRSRKTSKQGDFAAIVSVRYQDHDIKSVVLRQLVDLDQAYAA